MSIFDNLPACKNYLFYDHRSFTLKRLKLVFQEDQHGFLEVDANYMFDFDLNAIIGVGERSERRH